MEQGVKQNIKENKTYYITMTVVHWIDVFTRKNHCDAIIESLKYCQKFKGLNIFAYCIMSNHIHMLVNASEPFELKDVNVTSKNLHQKRYCFKYKTNLKVDVNGC